MRPSSLVRTSIIVVLLVLLLAPGACWEKFCSSFCKFSNSCTDYTYLTCSDCYPPFTMSATPGVCEALSTSGYLEVARTTNAGGALDPGLSYATCPKSG